MMKAWQVTKLADPADALSLSEIEKPQPKEGEVLIKVEGAALNFFDILLCQGVYQEKPPLPFTPGAEISGTIESVTANSKFNVGDRVLAAPQLPNGGFAEWVTVHEDEVYHIPDSMTFAQAAGFFITHHTGYYALKRCGRLQAGETLLVHAGSGGVGSAAIQLGKIMGAKVI